MFPLYFLYDVWAVLALRVALGAIFIARGWPKFKRLKGNAGSLDSADPSRGKLIRAVLAILEFFGGIALILGLGVMWLAALFAVESVLILLWRWSRRQPFVGGWELDLLVLAAAITLFSLGGGAWSLDRILFGIL